MPWYLMLLEMKLQEKICKSPPPPCWEDPCECAFPEMPWFPAYCPELSPLEILFNEFQRNEIRGRSVKMSVLKIRIGAVHSHFSAAYIDKLYQSIPRRCAEMFHGNGQRCVPLILHVWINKTLCLSIVTQIFSKSEWCLAELNTRFFIILISPKFEMFFKWNFVKTIYTILNQTGKFSGKTTHVLWQYGILCEKNPYPVQLST